jgi:hypothetical protein
MLACRQRNVRLQAAECAAVGERAWVQVQHLPCARLTHGVDALGATDATHMFHSLRPTCTPPSRRAPHSTGVHNRKRACAMHGQPRVLAPELAARCAAARTQPNHASLGSVQCVQSLPPLLCWRGRARTPPQPCGSGDGLARALPPRADAWYHCTDTCHAVRPICTCRDVKGGARTRWPRARCTLPATAEAQRHQLVATARHIAERNMTYRQTVFTR